MKLKTRILLTLAALSGLVFCINRMLDIVSMVSINQPVTDRPGSRASTTHRTTETRKIRLDVCKLRQPVYNMADLTSDGIMDKLNFSVSETHAYKLNFPEDERPMLSPQSDGRGKGNLSVIVVPHSMNDPGYLMTAEESYNKKTRRILDLVVDKLTQYPNMSFVWAEIGPLSVWWAQQKSDVRERFRRLVKNGQLEIVNGGWVVPDEATVHYEALLHQLVEGHRWLRTNLDTKPKSNWAISPFGHSGTMPYLLNLAGFDFMVVKQVHEAVRTYLKRQGTLGFAWRQFWDKDGSTDVPCQVLPYQHSENTNGSCGPATGVCSRFDFLYADPILDLRGDDDPDFVVMASSLYEQYRHTAKFYPFNTVLIPIGGLFRWAAPGEWDSSYRSYKRLFRYIGSRQDWRISVRFGTLRDYYNEIQPKLWEKTNKRHLRAALPIFSGDFFPYSDRNNEYWSGIFSSRAWLKFLGREVQAILRSCESLCIITCAGNPYDVRLQKECRDQVVSLNIVRADLAYFQHHKAVTGASRGTVINDISTRLTTAFSITRDVARWAGAKQLRYDSPLHVETNETYSLPIQTNVHLKPFASIKNDSYIVIFNPLVFERTETVTVRVNSLSVAVTVNNRSIPSQILPVVNRHGYVSESVFDLSFSVSVPPLGMVTTRIDTAPANSGKSGISHVTVKDIGKAFKQRPIFTTKPQPDYKEIVLENDCLKIEFEGKFGFMKAVTDKVSGKTTVVEMDFLQYTSYKDGIHVFQTQANAKSFITKENTNILASHGEVMSTVGVLNPLVHHFVSLFNTSGPQCWAIRVENLVKLDNTENAEIIMRIKTDLKNYGELYTDSNGFQTVRRRRRSRLPLGANTFPMTTMAFIQNRGRRLTVHGFQPLGVSSISDGLLDILLDRTMDTDDGRGVGEGLKRPPPATSRFIFTLESAGEHVTDHTDYSYPTLFAHRINDHLQYPVLIMQYPYRTLPTQSKIWQGLKMDVPCDFHLVAMRELELHKKDILGAAVIIHRRQFRCKQGLTCQQSWSDLQIGSLLPSVGYTTVSEWSLSFLEKRRQMKLADSIGLSPMGIKSFHIQWQ